VTSAADFITQNAPVAEAAQQQYGIPADVLLGIAGSESNWGGAPTYFGIINTPDWTGTHAEFVSGGSDCPGCTVDLRTYPNYAAGVQDFISLVSGAGRYSDAWAQRGNPDTFLHGLQSAGYGPPDWPGNVETDMALVDQQLASTGVPLPDSQGFSAAGSSGSASNGGGGAAVSPDGFSIPNPLSALNPASWVKALASPAETVGIFVLGVVVVLGGLLVLGHGSGTVRTAASTTARAAAA
jgi:hypothetical protein